jgi:high-affinity K+ transport system ATPase subunit B
MKGIQLATMTIILLIVAIIVLLIWGMLAVTSKGSIDIVLTQNALRQCCSDRAIYDCGDSSTVMCNVPWGVPESLDKLAKDAGVNNLNAFCNC